MRKAPLFIVLSLLLGFLLVTCGGEKGDTVKVGVIAELTGDMPAVGESCKKAAEMAAKEINDAGGLEVAARSIRSSSLSKTMRAKPSSRHRQPRS